MNGSAQISAVILAGGLGRRMGGEDKGLVEFEGKPLVAHVIDTIAPQVQQIFLNANRNLAAYRAFGHPVIADGLDGFQGPLAGILSALGQISTPLLLVVPCDAPRLPADLAGRLLAALQQEKSEIAVAHDGQRMQPVHALISRELRGSLEAFLASGERKIDRWYNMHKLAQADFSDRPEAFVNINTLDQLGQLEKGTASQ